MVLLRIDALSVPMAGSIMIGNVPDYAPSITKSNMINIRMSMDTDTIIDIIVEAVDNYEKYRHMQVLGKTMVELTDIFRTEDDYIEHVVNYEETKIMSRSLSQFLSKMETEELQTMETTYAGDY